MDRSTKDIFFAAFIEDTYPIEDFSQDGRVTSFIFKIEDKDWNKLKIQYLKSEYAKVENKIRRLKGLGK